MAENQNIQKQIEQLNKKMDIVLEEVYAQKQIRQTVGDLTTDLSIIGREVFKTSVTELDNAGIELDTEALKNLFLKLIRNVGVLNEMFEMFESSNDFIKDAAPILRQAALGGIDKMNELDRKGYFEFIAELSKIIDNIVTHFTKEDMQLLAMNIVSILETIKSLTQPDVLKALNNGISVYRSIDNENIPKYSFWKVFRELNTPEMKKGLGFMITFLKNIARKNNSYSKKN